LIRTYQNIFAICILSFTNVFLNAVEAKQGGAIYFPPLKNKIKVLDQKLDFHLIDDESIRLGNLFLHKAGLTMELVKTNDNDYLLRFKGPSKFMQSSQIILRDPNGRAAWKRDLKGETMQTQKGEQKIEGLINELRVYEQKADIENILSDLSEPVFFNYCLFNENETSRFNICSPDYRLVNDGRQWTLSQIKSKEIESKFIINGMEVGTEGQIQFSKEITSIAFTAKLLSGFLVEIKTREIPISLIDYEYQDESEFLLLKVRQGSAEETDSKKQEWVSKVHINRPFFYIEAENQLALKQELYIDSKLFEQQSRPKLVFAQPKTYNSSAEIDLKVKPNYALKALSKADKIEKAGETFTWKLGALKPGLNKPHYVEVNTDKKLSFQGAYDVVRGLPMETIFKIRATQTKTSEESKEGGVGGSLALNYYFTGVAFTKPADWNYLRWALFLEASVDNYQKEEQKKTISDRSVDLAYRFTPGLQNEDPTWGLSFGSLSHAYQISKNGIAITDKSTSPGVGLFFKNPDFSDALLGKAIFFRIKYHPSVIFEKLKNKTGSIFSFTWESRYQISQSLLLIANYANQTESYVFAEDERSSIITQIFAIGVETSF
jgi:hypothetical protein